MNGKVQISCVIFFALLFLIGLFMINTTDGKLGTVGFIGYNLSALAVLAELCAVITIIILKGEKKNER